MWYKYKSLSIVVDHDRVRIAMKMRRMNFFFFLFWQFNSRSPRHVFAERYLRLCESAPSSGETQAAPLRPGGTKALVPGRNRCLSVCLGQRCGADSLG